MKKLQFWMVKMIKVNELALACQERGYVTKELYEATKGVAWSLMEKKHVDYDDRVGLCGLAVCEALRVWDRTKGDFAITVFYQALKVIQAEYMRMSEIVRKPQHFRGEDHKSITTVYPDGIKRDETATDSLWDVLIAYEPETDDAYGVARVELKKAVEGLSVRYRALYDWLYVDEGTQISFAREHGLSKQWVGVMSQRLVDKLGKKVKQAKMLNDVK